MANNSSYFTVQPIRWQFRTFCFSPVCSLHNAPPFQCIVPPFSVDWPLRRASRALRRHLPVLLSPSLTPFRWSELSPQQRNSLLAAGLSWFFSGFDVMLYSALLPQTPPGSLHVQSGCWLSHHAAPDRHRPRQLSVWAPRRSLRPQAHVDLLGPHLFRLHISLRTRAEHRRPRNLSHRHRLGHGW